jgi:hypothetical protein
MLRKLYRAMLSFLTSTISFPIKKHETPHTDSSHLIHSQLFGSQQSIVTQFHSITVSLAVHARLSKLIVLAGRFHSDVILSSFFAVVSLTRTIVYGNDVGALSHGSYTLAIVVSTHCCSENKGKPGFGYCVEVKYDVHCVLRRVVGNDVSTEGMVAVGVGVEAARATSVESIATVARSLVWQSRIMFSLS